MIANAKEEYLMNLGQKLADHEQGSKTYWMIFNRLINKKKVVHIPPLLEHDVFITNVQTKATILNDFFVQQC